MAFHDSADLPPIVLSRSIAVLVCGICGSFGAVGGCLVLPQVYLSPLASGGPESSFMNSSATGTAEAEICREAGEEASTVGHHRQS